MEILDRNALEAIGVQWGGATAGNIRQATPLVGQGFQSAPSATRADPARGAACCSPTATV